MIIDANPSGKLKKNTALKEVENSTGQRKAAKVVLIGGATASGKSRFALDLAREAGGEIINADSRQIYRFLSIGTSQPKPDELRNIPHHLYAFLDPTEDFTAADFEKRASELIHQISDRGKLPIVVGGTGFYMKALLRGLWPVAPKNERLRKRIRSIHQRRGAFWVHRLLMRLDPASAARIAPQDTYRMVRALEIFFQSGVRPSQLSKNQQERFNARKYALDPGREELSKNIHDRTEIMFSSGWVEEVQAILRSFPDFEKMPAARSLGYSEVLKFIKGEITFSQCRETIELRTRQYAKRQTTWFRNQDQFEQVPSETPLRKIIDSVLQWYLI